MINAIVYSGELTLVEKAMEICRTLHINLKECTNYAGTGVLDYINLPSAKSEIVRLIGSYHLKHLLARIIK